MRSMPCRGPDGPPGGPAPAARPVPIADPTTARAHASRRSSSSCGRSVPGPRRLGRGLSRRFLRRDPETMATVTPILLAAIGEPGLDRAGLDEAARLMAATIRGHGAARCAIDIALHDLVGKILGRPSTPCVGCPRTCHRPTSPSASTSRRSSPSGRGARPISPRSRSRSADRATWPPCVPSETCMAARSASTRTPAGRGRTPSRCCRSWSSSVSSWSSSRSRHAPIAILPGPGTLVAAGRRR